MTEILAFAGAEMGVDYKQKQILVVDDFPEMRSSLRGMLEGFGARGVCDTRNGKETMQLLEKKSFDIILCDYNLGEGKNGQQVLEEGKHRGLIKSTTVFMMVTAESTVSMVMGAVEYEPDGYLTKPFNKQVLKSRLDKLTEKKQAFEPAEKALRREDYPQVVALCDARIAENDRYSLEFMKLKCETLILGGQYRKAAALLEQLLSQRSITWAALFLGQVYYHEKNFPQAKEVLQRLIDEHKNYVPGYDWLAKTMLASGLPLEAQNIVKSAVDLSPNALLRLKTLADLAIKNTQWEIAERALKSAVKLGKYSCFRSPSDYLKLAKVQLEKGAPLESMRVLTEARKEFAHDDIAATALLVTEGLVHVRSGKMDEAEKARDAAAQWLKSHSRNIPPEVMLDYARLCHQSGDESTARGLLEDLIRSHIEEEEIIEMAQQLFAEMGKQSEGSGIISALRDHIKEINKEGVRLANEGRLEEAINLFEKAAQGLPNNLAISLNTAQAMLLFVQKNGNEDTAMMTKARNLLDRVKEKNPANIRFQQLFSMYKQVAGIQP